jgi:para-nitrobenzyl esterase
MKRFALFFSLLFFAQLTFAQNPGCDGVRYNVPVFANVTKTTVPFATAVGYLPNQPVVTLNADVYEPTGDTIADRPAVVLAHGGSFIFGDKADMQSTCELIASEGYVVLSIDYRLYPVLVLGFPDSISIMGAAMKAVADMKAAVRFLREDAAGANQFRIDTSHIFIGGYSAGAVTALHATYMDNGNTIPAFIQSAINANGGFEGNSGDSLNQSFSSHSLAVVNMSGGLYRASWLDAGENPLVSIHGTADDVVPYTAGLAAGIAYLQGSSMIHARAEQVGVWNDLTTVQGAGHTDLYSSATYAAQLTAFFVKASALLESLTCQTSATHLAPTEQATWSVYPNPVSDHASITLPEDMPIANVTILNATGQSVFSANGFNSGANVQTAAWPAGIYWVQIRDSAHPEKVLKPKLLVKQ